MKLISRIEIDHFRSIKETCLDNIGDFTALAGLNNSGKSNVLRALHAFFSDRTDADTPVAFSRDYHCHSLSAKQRKRFTVTITFALPPSFKFRKGLESAEKLLGRAFKLKKLWVRDAPEPYYYLNDDSSQLDSEQRNLVEQFLSLMSFRYIPNRVLPLDIIRKEHLALRDVLIRRLAKEAKKQEDVFKAIGNTSEILIRSLQSAVHDACPDIGSIRLATPASWQDLIFAFGYKLRLNNSELDDTVQGSGIQSLLMFETLSLIDRDYFQKFGWRQAAVWAVEEPESSLHASLEARVAQYLCEIATNPSSRLQILCTTHSDVMLQQADQVYLAEMASGASQIAVCDKRAALEITAKKGISRWTHPVLRYPLRPIVLVEGKYDCAFIEQAFRLLAPQKSICVTYLELLQGEQVTGGVDELKKYVRANAKAIESRFPDAPVVVLLDWDSEKRKSDFEKLISQNAPYRVAAWPQAAFNPKLDAAFRGIERHMSDRIIDAADANIKVIGDTKDGKKTVSTTNYGSLKEAIFRVVQTGITRDDLVHSSDFLLDLLKKLP